MGVTTAVEIVVLGLATLAAWLSVRPAPELDWERLWKTALANVIRGDVEAMGGDFSEWWKRLSVVPYHPAGRNAYLKLTMPTVGKVSVPALEGERALVERLAEVASVSERWFEMYRNDPAAEEALTSDPAALGAAYDPAIPIGPEVGWEDVARWTAGVQSAIARRMAGVVVAVVGFEAQSLVLATPHARVVDLSASEHLDDALLSCCVEAHERLLIVARGKSVPPTIEALHANPSLRDRVLTVLSIAADWTGSEEWLQTNFLHKNFDTELNRRTLYLAISDGSSTGLHAVPQIFPDPVVPESGWAPIESVDLGILPLHEQNPELFARALWVLFCFCLSSR